MFAVSVPKTRRQPPTELRDSTLDLAKLLQLHAVRGIDFLKATLFSSRRLHDALWAFGRVRARGAQIPGRHEDGVAPAGELAVLLLQLAVGCFESSHLRGHALDTLDVLLGRHPLLSIRPWNSSFGHTRALTRTGSGFVTNSRNRSKHCVFRSKPQALISKCVKANVLN